LEKITLAVKAKEKATRTIQYPAEQRGERDNVTTHNVGNCHVFIFAFVKAVDLGH
jgi:hypothetical protein